METQHEIEIKRILSTSRTAVIVLTALSERQRDRQTSDLTRALASLTRTGRGVPKEELLTVFRELERAGVGRLIKNKDGRLSFNWFVSLKEVGHLAKSSSPTTKRPADPIVQTILNSHTLSDTQKIRMLLEYFEGSPSAKT